jgi:hypothetical protein
MATIPMGNFGQAVARPEQAPRVPQGNALSDATAGLGRTVGGIVDAENTRRMREDEEVRHAEVRAKTITALTGAKDKLADLHDEFSNAVLNREIEKDGAEGLYTKQASKLLDGIGADLPQAQRSVVLAELNGDAARFANGVRKAVTQRTRQDVTAAITQNLEYLQRQFLKDPVKAQAQADGLIDQLGPRSTLAPDQLGKLKQGFGEKSLSMFYEAAAQTALEKGDSAGLRTLREQITGNDGERLDPTRRTQLRHQWLVWEKQIEADKARQTDVAEREAHDVTQKLVQFVSDGMAPDVQYQNEVRAATKGTRFAPLVEQAIADGQAGAGFGAQSLPRQAAALAAVAGKPTNPEQVADYERGQRIHQKQKVAYAEDPWAAGTKFHRLPVVNEQAILSPMQLIKAAQERMPLMNNLEAASGEPAPLLRPAEVAQAVSALQGASIRERTEILGQIGSMLSGPRLNAFAEQVGKGSKPMALTLKLGADRTTAGRMASELVQLGAQALADKTVKKDDAALSGWRADIAAHVRGTLGDTKAEDEVIDAAFYVRAAQELDSAKASGFTRGFGNGSEDALGMVVGKPIERAGVKTFLPKGMTTDQFDTKARELLAAGKGQTVFSRGSPVGVEEVAQRFSGYGLRMVRPGEYLLMLNNAPFTVDKEGTQPLRLRVQ